MAVAAVFWNSATGPSSKKGLLDSLRFDAEQLDSVQGTIDNELRTVRVGLYRRLGSARVADVLTTAYSENAATDAEIVRLAANQAEAIWLKIRLLLALPLLWMDASSDQLKVWNEDSFSREQASERDKVISALQAELESLLAIVIEDKVEVESTRIRISTYGPENTFCAGQSVAGAVSSPRATTPYAGESLL